MARLLSLNPRRIKRTAIWKAIENINRKTLKTATTIKARLRLMYDSTGFSLLVDGKARQVWMHVDPVHSEVVKVLSSARVWERDSSIDDDDVSLTLISVFVDRSSASRKLSDEGAGVDNHDCTRVTDVVEVVCTMVLLKVYIHSSFDKSYHKSYSKAQCSVDNVQYESYNLAQPPKTKTASRSG